MTPSILVLNAGSSSLKFALYPAQGGLATPLLHGKIAGIGTAPQFRASDANGTPLPPELHMTLTPKTQADGWVTPLLDWLAHHPAAYSITAAGHRVVHGGQHQSGPARVTDTLMAELQALSPLAPLHQPYSLAAIRALAALRPDLPQVACFDTSFHRSQPRLAQLFALPRALSDAGILRYGFHGLSYDYIAAVLPAQLGAKAEGRVIVAHLGHGASLCAMKARQSVASSMGFTALDGLMMGSRCGSLDPGVLLYLLGERAMNLPDLTDLLYHQSGLQGVSGISSDMAVLEASAAPEAQEAIALFCYRAAGAIGELAAALGGLDALVFTAGIGENSARVRREICAQLGWMGVDLDAKANAEGATHLGSKRSGVAVLMIPTDEESVIAAATLALLRG
jgi:acetate kinase